MTVDGETRNGAVARPAQDTSASTRIDALRIALISSIVILHAKPVVPPDAAATVVNVVGRFLQEGPFRAAVSLLSAISGYLLFKSKLDQRPWMLFRKKSRTLLLPLLMWNLPFALITALAQSKGKFLEQRLQLAGPEASVGAWLNALVAFAENPIDFPMHFIRDLYVLCLLAIVIGPLLRRSPVAGILGVHALFGVFDWDGVLVMRDEMPTMFFVGGALAITGANLRAFDAAWRPLIALFMVTALAMVIDVDSFRIDFLRILGVISLWPAFGALMKTRAGQWLAARSHYSFWLYASHAPIMELLNKAWRARAQALPDELFWLVGPLATIAISIAAYHLCAAIAPAITALATGGRLKTPEREVEPVSQPA